MIVLELTHHQLWSGGRGDYGLTAFAMQFATTALPLFFVGQMLDSLGAGELR